MNQSTTGEIIAILDGQRFGVVVLEQGVAAAIRDRLTKYDVLLVENEKLKKCEDCDGTGQQPIGEHFVSREMALDAGQPEMAGASLGVEYGPCSACGGTGYSYAARVLAENDKLKKKICEQHESMTSLLAENDKQFSRAETAEAALEQKKKDYDWMMAQHDAWKACSFEESRRKKEAEAALAKAEPVLAAIGGKGEGEIEWDDCYTTRVARDILRAALNFRDEEAKHEQAEDKK